MLEKSKISQKNQKYRKYRKIGHFRYFRKYHDIFQPCTIPTVILVIRCICPPTAGRRVHSTGLRYSQLHVTLRLGAVGRRVRHSPSVTYQCAVDVGWVWAVRSVTETKAVLVLSGWIRRRWSWNLVAMEQILVPVGYSAMDTDDVNVISVVTINTWIPRLRINDTFYTKCRKLVGWLRSTVGRTPVFGRRTDHVLWSACSRRVTTMWVNRPLQVSQLGQLSLSSFRGR